MSKPALGQGFFFGPGYGAGYGAGFGAAPGWRGGGWGGGFGVAPSRIDISIGVPPSFPYPIGVPPGHLIPPPFSFYGHDPVFGGYPDYRSQYTLRVLQTHRAQLEFAESLGLISPLGFSGGSSAEHMIQSARRLDQSLARRGEQGDIWRQYLSTELIVASDRQPLTDAQWMKVLQNFDGVVANGDLRWVMRSDGFAETRQWVSAWFNAKAAVENRAGDVGDDGSPPTPPAVPPEAPKPGSSQEPSIEVLPAPARARL